MLRRALRRHLCAFVAFLAMQGIAHAVVLNWDSVSWTDGSLSNTYQPDGSDPGSALSVNLSVNGGGAPFAPYSGDTSRQAPAVIAAFEGGQGAIHNSLVLALDLANTSQSVSVTVYFGASAGANNVSFQLFDVDFSGTAQDLISVIQGTSAVDGTTVMPTITGSAANTVTTGANPTVVGSSPASDTGATSNRGNVTIDFGGTAISSFTFTYGATTAFSNPGYQHIGLYNINFTPIPEMNPAIISIFSCLAATGLVLRHRARFRK